MDNKIEDIYFDERYGKISEKMENGKVGIFNYICSEGNVRNIFIKREIPIKLNNKVYYDITTPYGYGGPIIKYKNEKDKEKILSEYKKKFSLYCEENNIVSEFIRFHPIVNNACDFKTIYDIEKNRMTLGTNLKAYNDPVKEEFSKSCRKNIRRALKAGVKYEIEEAPKSIDDFIKVYYSTMDRNKADNFYYFDKNYFEDAIKYFKNNILIVKAIFEGKTIAAGFYFIFNKTIHIHLSGTLSEYLYLSPAYILRYAITLWGKERGYNLIHHGGGRSSSKDDGLYKFKKNFSKHTEFEFFIGKKIWNESIYNELCNIKKIDKNEQFFPSYRK